MKKESYTTIEEIEQRKEDLKEIERLKATIEEQVKKSIQYTFYEQLIKNYNSKIIEVSKTELENAKTFLSENKYTVIDLNEECFENYISNFMDILELEESVYDTEPSEESKLALANTEFSRDNDQKLTDVFYSVQERYILNSLNNKRFNKLIQLATKSPDTKETSIDELKDLIDGLVVNLFEIISIIQLQNNIIDYLNVDYTVKLDIKPFKETLENTRNMLKKNNINLDFTVTKDYISKKENNSRKNIEVCNYPKMTLQVLINSLAKYPKAKYITE